MTDEADTTASSSPGAPPSSGPTFTGPSFTREHLVRPRQGRYVAGVCAALARATNTDPVLWRVLVAVLGVLSGVGVLLYLIGWLIIPAEGDTASPIESLLGKGRSGMAPLSVVLLGAAAVVSFGFIVHDGMRASLLAAAVIVGAVLLIKRNNGDNGPATPPPPPDATFPPAPPADAPPATTAFDAPTAPFEPPTTAFAAPAAAAPAAEPVTAPLPPLAPQPPTPPMPPYAPPASGYRPPFAPHGPWASTPPAYQPPQPPPRAPKPPKPPRERSKLGRLTFFAVVMVIGLMAVIDMAGARIAISAYFAAALVTIALGLIVGAWFGRARGLIALAVLVSIALAVSTGVERWGGEVGNSVYHPRTVTEIADRYDFTAGNATLDLRDVTFTDQPTVTTLTMKFGQLRVLLPPTVDATATLSLDTGRAVIFGKEYTDKSVSNESATDLGTDGEGGGSLKLDLQMDTGNVEVIR
ncbi:PspC domain-containing protein [Paractinoplanes rhizophilus]|uniref:PspC domain-containing protein n=1 Tax=Paractinoplanes rhizophilus TaxID=1416877 RepID=A0ABW2HLD0_9ACTN